MMFKKILFCTDFSENSDHAFAYAFNLARAYDAMLLILHVIVEPVCYYWSIPKGVDELIAKQTERVKQGILAICKRSKGSRITRFSQERQMRAEPWGNDRSTLCRDPGRPIDKRGRFL